MQSNTNMKPFTIKFPLTENEFLILLSIIKQFLWLIKIIFLKKPYFHFFYVKFN